MAESTHRIHGSGPEPFEACPDGGRCWHGCPLSPATEAHPEGEGLPCWRVTNAYPLSGYGEDWTPEDKSKHAKAAAITELVEYVKDKADAAIVLHEPGQITESELPAGWVLESTEHVAGKRVRIYRIENSDAE